LGISYIKQKKYKEAEKYLKKAIEIGEELHIIYELQGFYTFPFRIIFQNRKSIKMPWKHTKNM
jgi:tetratricopeptide (TPR) repeat protein